MTGRHWHRLGAGLALWLGGCSAGLPTDPNPFGNPQPVALDGYTGVAMEPALSPDGQTLFFNDSNAPGADTNLHWATRVDDLTFTWRGPISAANSNVLDAVPSMDLGGTLYFISTRSYAADHLFTVHRCHFDAGAVTSLEEVPGLPSRAFGLMIFDAFISRDGDQLWFAEGDFTSSALGAANLYLATRNPDGSFSRSPDNDTLFKAVNQLNAAQYAPAVSADGLELFFTRLTGTGSTTAIYHSFRTSTAAPWGTPDVIPALVGGVIEAAAPTADGKALYYHHQAGPTPYRLERVTRN